MRIVSWFNFVSDLNETEVKFIKNWFARKIHVDKNYRWKFKSCLHLRLFFFHFKRNLPDKKIFLKFIWRISCTNIIKHFSNQLLCFFFIFRTIKYCPFQCIQTKLFQERHKHFYCTRNSRIFAAHGIDCCKLNNKCFFFWKAKNSSIFLSE